MELQATSLHKLIQEFFILVHFAIIPLLHNATGSNCKGNAMRQMTGSEMIVNAIKSIMLIVRILVVLAIPGLILFYLASTTQP
jgi:hypothetical protein